MHYIRAMLRIPIHDRTHHSKGAKLSHAQAEGQTTSDRRACTYCLSEWCWWPDEAAVAAASGWAAVGPQLLALRLALVVMAALGWAAAASGCSAGGGGGGSGHLALRLGRSSSRARLLQFRALFLFSLSLISHSLAFSLSLSSLLFARACYMCVFYTRSRMCVCGARFL